MVAPFVAVVDAEQVRAAVTVALDAAMESMVDEMTARVLAALQSIAPAAVTPARFRDGLGGENGCPTFATGAAARPASAATARAGGADSGTGNGAACESVRVRSGFILGLDLEPDSPAPDPRSTSK